MIVMSFPLSEPKQLSQGSFRREAGQQPSIPFLETRVWSTLHPLLPIDSDLSSTETDGRGFACRGSPLRQHVVSPPKLFFPAQSIICLFPAASAHFCRVRAPL